MKRDSFSEIYKIDESTDRYMIEIALDQYTDIFNAWDPAPFKRRELNPDLKLYLEQYSDEIPSKYAIELCFAVPAGMRDERVEEESRIGLKNSFISKRYFLGKEIKKSNTRMLLFVVIGLVLLWVAKTATSRFGAADASSILFEGLAITGWVFLWEAVSLLSFTNRELYHRYQTHKRLQNAPVIFQEAEKP